MSPTATRSTTSYLNYGMIGWTPEMDTCTDGRRREPGCRQFSYPGRRGGHDQARCSRRTSFVRAQRRRSRSPTPTARRTGDDDPGGYQVKADRWTSSRRTASTSPTAPRRPIEAVVRKSLGPADVRVALTTPGNIATKRATMPVIPMETAPAGRALRRGARRATSSAAARPSERSRPSAPSGRPTTARPVRPPPGASSTSPSSRAASSRRFSYRVAAGRRPTRRRSACW